MNALLRYCRWMAGFCLLGLSLTTAAQVKTADIEQLRKDMYRLFNKPDSLQQYIQVTNQLKPGNPNRAKYIDMESNAPVGLWPELEYVGESIDNIKGYTLLVYSDGLTEAENEEQEQHGEERLLELMRNDEFVNTKSTVNMILNDVATHVGSADQSDDLTILCLKID